MDHLSLAGLIVADGEGLYFVIASDDLVRFRVPDEWCVALDAFVGGAEPERRPPDVAGFGNAGAWDGTRALLERLLGGDAADLPVAARRLAAWAVLP